MDNGEDQEKQIEKTEEGKQNPEVSGINTTTSTGPEDCNQKETTGEEQDKEGGTGENIQGENADVQPGPVVPSMADTDIKPEGDGRTETANSERDASTDTEEPSPDQGGDINPELDVRPDVQESDITAQIIGNFVKIIIKDPSGYIFNINIVPIKTATRVSYNAIKNELSMALPETLGEISERVFERPNPEYREKGGNFKKPGQSKPPSKTISRREISGNIESFKVTLHGTDLITQFLLVYLGIDNVAELNKVFEGFEAHRQAKEYIDKVMSEKKKEHEQKTESKIVDMQGNKY